MRAEAADFELLRALGQVSYAVESNSERTLTWSGGEDGSVPDSFSVSGRGASTGDAVMKLYAGKVVGWDDGAMSPSNAVPDVLLKEYVNAAAAPMADAEVTAYQMLYGDPNDSTIGQTWDGQVLGEAFDPASIPVVPLIAYFASAPVAGAASAAAGSLWTAQAWGPGGLQKLADYPSARQAINEQKWWPPVQRARDAGLGPRMRFTRNAAAGILRCVEAIHRRGVAHGAIDASAFAASTLEDASADALEVRLMNFGFASALTEESRRNDLRAAAATIAELAFSALAAGGRARAHVARSVAPALRGRVSAGRKGGARVLFGGARVRGGGGVLRVQGQAGRRVAAPGGLLARGRERRGRARARGSRRDAVRLTTYRWLRLTTRRLSSLFTSRRARYPTGEVRRFAARLGNVSVAVLVPGTFRFTPSGGRCLLPSP